MKITKTQLRQIIREEIQKLNEAISKEEWQGYVRYGKELKKYLSRNDLRGQQIKVRVIKSARPDPWIEVSLKNWRDEVIPNDFRVKAAKAIGASSVRDWDNVSYGNIHLNSVSLHYSHWKKMLSGKIKESF